MRLLSVLSGLVLSLTGAFCLAFYTNAFSGLAFVIGIFMCISGIMTMISYIISAKSVSRLPDTVLVEGLVTMLFGFAVLNNQVMDTMVAMFFGTWLTLSGSTRLSQSFAVSRYSTKDWAKIIPISAVNTLLGVVMLMQTLISAFNSVTIIGIAFILNGLSMFVYAMYMKPYVPKQKELEAIEETQVKLAAAEAKIAQRDALRKLSKKERDAAKAEIRRQHKAEIQARRNAELEEKQSKRGVQTVTTDTISFTAAEVNAVNGAMGLAENGNSSEDAEKNVPSNKDEANSVDKKTHNPIVIEPIDIEAVKKTLADEPLAEDIAAADEALPAAGAAGGADSDISTDEVHPKFGEVILSSDDQTVKDLNDIIEMRDYSAEAAQAPLWKRPTEIPSLREAKSLTMTGSQMYSDEDVSDAPAKITAINIEELENGINEVNFEPVQLPDLELESSGGEAKARAEILKALDENDLPKASEPVYEPVKLDELIPETKKVNHLSENEEVDLNLTSSFTFEWKN